MESHRDFLLMKEESSTSQVSQLEIRNGHPRDQLCLSPDVYPIPVKIPLKDGRVVTQKSQPHKAP